MAKAPRKKSAAASVPASPSEALVKKQSKRMTKLASAKDALSSNILWRRSVQGLMAPLHILLETTADRCAAALRFRNGPGEQPGSTTLWPGYDYTVEYQFSPQEKLWRLTVEQRPAATLSPSPSSPSSTSTPSSSSLKRAAVRSGLPAIPGMVAPGVVDGELTAMQPPTGPTAPGGPLPLVTPMPFVAPVPPFAPVPPVAAMPPTPMPPFPFPPPPVGICHCQETGMYRDCPDGHQVVCSATDIICVPSPTGPNGQGP